jgi:hypothetical protein
MWYAKIRRQKWQQGFEHYGTMHRGQDTAMQAMTASLPDSRKQQKRRTRTRTRTPSICSRPAARARRGGQQPAGARACRADEGLGYPPPLCCSALPLARQWREYREGRQGVSRGVLFSPVGGPPAAPASYCSRDGTV